ncbi:hypothetical protein [Prosthecobacter sp.]|uniref:hypothetical protein n=1 Tax=Prosthecobacter sp. TaxID=1965333 RepID=UPI00378392E3
MSRAEAARLLGCDPATITRRVQAGALRTVQTVIGERLEVGSLFPGLSCSAVEQLMRRITPLPARRMGSRMGKMPTLAAEPAEVAGVAESVGQLVDSHVVLKCNSFKMNDIDSEVTDSIDQIPPVLAGFAGGEGVGEPGREDDG